MWQALRFFGGEYREETTPSLFSIPTLLSPLRQPPYSKSLMLKHELDTLGLLLSLHPLERYESILKGLDFVRARDLRAHIGKRVTTIGWLVTGKTVHTKDGEPMKFVSFEDTG
jgi:error-prone DNA polymerase